MELHNIEKQILLALDKKPQQPIAELVKNTGLDEASVNHASAWLSAKKMVSIAEKIVEKAGLGKEGAEYIKIGMPERRVLSALAEGEKTIGEIAGIAQGEIGLMWLKKLGAAKIAAQKASLTGIGKEYLTEKMPQEAALEKIAAGERADVAELRRRGKILEIKEIRERTIKLLPAGRAAIAAGIKIEPEVSQLTSALIVTKKWKDVKLKKYDISMPVKEKYPGRRHFMNQAVDYVRRVWLEMGFKEMRGPLIGTEFWNFDALFVPQEHPAREMQDTLFIEGKGGLPDAALVKRVKKAHEKGAAGSIGWGYEWNEEIAKRLIMRPHTTILSAQTLTALKKDDWPAKYFAVGRCFRNETLDWKHLFEFNQFEGIVVDENANFGHLLGYLKEFYKKIGYERARFRPAYFPYTEPSLEIEVYHPVHKQWMELGGAGIFRPEVTEPLLGEPIPVLAWGPGLDRGIMEYYEIKDMRELYKNDIKQMREIKQWLRG